MLCWALNEQARYEHMPDKYKDRHLVYYYSVAVAHILGLPNKHESTTVAYKITNQRGESQMHRVPKYVS